MLTFNGKGFTRQSAVDPSMTHSRRRAVTEFEATMNGLTAVLGQPDTEPGKYPCWLIDADGQVVSVYYLGLDPYTDPATLFTFSVGAERGHTTTADAVADAIVSRLAPESAKAEDDPEVARICRNMDLLGGLSDDPFAGEG